MPRRPEGSRAFGGLGATPRGAPPDPKPARGLQSANGFIAASNSAPNIAVDATHQRAQERHKAWTARSHAWTTDPTHSGHRTRGVGVHVQFDEGFAQGTSVASRTDGRLRSQALHPTLTFKARDVEASVRSAVERVPIAKPVELLVPQESLVLQPSHHNPWSDSQAIGEGSDPGSIATKPLLRPTHRLPLRSRTDRERAVARSDKRGTRPRLASMRLVRWSRLYDTRSGRMATSAGG